MTALAKYVEGNDEKISAFPYTPGAVIISSAGELLFDSIAQGKRLQITGTKVSRKASSITTGSLNTLTTGGTYEVSAGLTNAPTANPGLMYVIQGAGKISQTFIDTVTSFVYTRIGTVGTSSTTFGSWVTPNK